MKYKKGLSKQLLVLVLCSTSFLNAVVVAEGDPTLATGITFSTAAICNTFHRPSKTWFVGLTNGALTYSVSKATLTAVNQTPTFVPIGTNAALTTDYISNITTSTLASNPTNPFVIVTSTTDNTTFPTLFQLIADDGTGYVTSAALEDSASATTGRVLKIVGTPNHVIAAVKANGSTAATFGVTAGDGIALTRILRNNPTAFTYYNTADGTTLAPTALAINATAAGAVFGVTNDSVASTFLDMVYSDDLKRIYVSSIITGSGAGGDKAFGVSIIKVDEDTNILTKLTQCAAAALDSTTRVIGFLGNAHVVALRKLGVMKTSTGFYYLIVVGAAAVAATGANTRNEVHAIALVSGNNTDLDGTFARNDDLTTTDFTIAATGATHLPAGTDAQASVGGGVLPIPADSATKFVTQLEVIGDTVYVSLQSDAVGATAAPGIYYSQAVFNNVGKIVRWTDWAKAAPFVTGNSATDGSVSGMAIDITSGEIWGINSTGTIASKTEWTNTGPAVATSLVGKLNSSLSTGCFSVYDLNQSTLLFGNQNLHRYALFGGRGKIVFARVSTPAATAYITPQTVTTDFSVATQYLETTLPADTAPVTALCYSKWAAAFADGYLFAGTKNGCYVWAATAGGAGVVPTAFGLLNAAPFAGTFTWQKLTSIAGDVKAIKSIGNAVYILARDTTGGVTVTDKLYKITVGVTLAALVTNTITIAASNTAPILTAIPLFLDFEIVDLAGDGTTEQILLLTNNGIFESATVGGVQGAADQTAAVWTLITDPVTTGIAFDRIATPGNTRIPTTFWISQWADNAAGNGTFTDSSLMQIGSATGTVNDKPAGQFNSNSTTLLPTLNPVKYLWSDGARRFTISVPPTSDGMFNEIHLLPYQIDATKWNVISEQNISPDMGTLAQDRYYWIQAIGATGNIMAGGNRGVTSLE